MNSIKLDHGGMRGLLKTPEVRSIVGHAADALAAHVNALGIGVGDRTGGASEYDLPVVVKKYTTDRAAASVTLAHPAGLAVEAKHGALRKAAASLGLTVRSRT